MCVEEAVQENSGEMDCDMAIICSIKSALPGFDIIQIVKFIYDKQTGLDTQRHQINKMSVADVCKMLWCKKAQKNYYMVYCDMVTIQSIKSAL